MVISSRRAYRTTAFTAMITSDQHGYALMRNI